MYRISIDKEEIQSLELIGFSGEIHVIDEIGPEFDKAIRYLKRQKYIGFDTESRPCFSPGQPHSLYLRLNMRNTLRYTPYIMMSCRDVLVSC